MSKLNEVLRNLLAVTQEGAILPTALGSNKEFESSFSSHIHMLERKPMDTGLPGPQFQYMKALNQMTSVVPSDICKATASIEADRSKEIGGRCSST